MGKSRQLRGSAGARDGAEASGRGAVVRVGTGTAAAKLADTVAGAVTLVRVQLCVVPTRVQPVKLARM